VLSRWGLGPAHQGPFRRGTRLPTPAHYSSLLVPHCHKKKKNRFNSDRMQEAGFKTRS
jgi:hypothetical protein